MNLRRHLEPLARALRAAMRDAPGHSEAVLAERDRWKASAEISEHSFRTTAADRDRLKEMVSELADPLDAGFFRLDFARFAFGNGEQGSSLAREWTTLIERGAHAELMQSVLANVPVGIEHALEGEYFRPFAAYYLASLLASLNDFERARHYAGLVEIEAPPDATDLLPYDLRQGSRLAYYQQRLAIDQDRPGAVLISMPRSASGFLTHGLSHAAQVPVLRITVGEAFYSVPVPRWVRQVARGGATTHEHIVPSVINLAALREGGLCDAWIQVRDPRDATYSSLIMEGPIGFERPVEFQGEQGFLTLSAALASWIDGWMTAAQDPECGFKIRFLRFEEVTSDLPSVIRRVLAERWTPEIAERAHDYLDRRAPINFRKGTGQEWRSRFSPEACERAWEAIPPNVRSFLDLKR